MRVAESKYSISYDEAQPLKQRLATGVSYDGEEVQCLNNASKDVLEYTDALHAKVVKSQNNVRESFCSSFASLG